MPAAATHIEFGKDFLDAIPKKNETTNHRFTYVLDGNTGT